jgi:hypothetical protein
MQQDITQSLNAVKNPTVWDATEGEFLIISREYFCQELAESFNIGRSTSSIGESLVAVVTSLTPLFVVGEFKDEFFGLKGDVWQAILLIFALGCLVLFIWRIIDYIVYWRKGSLDSKIRANNIFIELAKRNLTLDEKANYYKLKDL